jgi:antitoxin (DNA-binding transcriptional repressor) of toxin-antitoxin stability system
MPFLSKLSLGLSLGVAMLQVNIHQAKTNLSRLVQKAAEGESFIIAKSGKPMVKVSAYMPPPDPAARYGFLKGQIQIPEDFNGMGASEIMALFEGAQ